MSTPVIKVEGLGKEYLIGARVARRETFREMLTSSFAAPFRRFRQLSGAAAPAERIWALKDVSFEVGEGEVVGIIGRNGAGKSTLLKILSRITEPTEGRALIRGRVASLLEVGTGFHLELTGRENIHLNGAILGMSRAEIDRKFDEIVAFAEVERFLDTPVKRYSSGMAVRLAFAVAAHLDPDVLIVDEVLAVGDASFQRRCLGKIQNVASSGRTILFVSHNMNAITRYCSRGMYLDDGVLVQDGHTREVVSNYLTAGVMDADAFSGQYVANEEYEYIKSVRMVNSRREVSNVIGHSETIVLEVDFSGHRDKEFINLGVRVTNEFGDLLFTCWDAEYVPNEGTRPDRVYLETCEIPEFFLLPGHYMLQISLHSFVRGRLAAEEWVDLPFVITKSGFNEGNFPRRGLVAPKVVWERQSRWSD